MTDVTLPRYSELNDFRPANACYGEVVCIELYLNGESLGYSKRKSIHVPPSSNAYWNFVALRSLAVEYANKYGIERRVRDALYLTIDQAVRRIHENELKLAYLIAGDKTQQYYDLHLSVNPGKLLGVISATQTPGKVLEVFSVDVS